MIRGNQGVSIATNLFVMLVVVLLFTTLFLFITENNKVDLQLTKSVLALSVYSRTDLIDNYLQESISKSAKGCESKDEFISNLEYELYYGKKSPTLFLIDMDNKIYFPEFESIVSQVNIDNILINEVGSGKEFVINFDLIIRDELDSRHESSKIFKDKYARTFFIEHNFVKEFRGLA